VALLSLETLYSRCCDFLSPTELRLDELLAPYTTFKVGGEADLLICPRGDNAIDHCLAVVRIAREEQVELCVLGGGSNVLVADKGVRGAVLLTTGCNQIRRVAAGENSVVSRGSIHETAVQQLVLLAVDCGAEMEAVVRYCEDNSLSGMEFIAGIPGTVGGAVWMNARCYERSISDLLVEAIILDESGRRVVVPFSAEDFGYKRSPFQKQKSLILSALFALTNGEPAAIRAAGDSHREDRGAKGHYRLPSAGSTFKNNHAWGKPTGLIVDELGLRGLQIGGAAVAPWHGNIVVNTGDATAADIRAVVEEVTRRVHAALGIRLEPEILFLGDWH